MQISVAAVTTAPHATAFAAAVDITGWPGFISAVRGVEILTPGPLQPGTRLRITRRLLGGSMAAEVTVADVVAPHAFVLTASWHGTEYRVEHRFEPEGARTLMTLAFEARPATASARLLAPLAWLLLDAVKRQLVADLADLAREAERRHRANPGSAA